MTAGQRGRGIVNATPAAAPVAMPDHAAFAASKAVDS